MPLLSLWDKGLSWQGPGEGKSHLLSLPSSYCLVSSVYRGSETLPERLHHLAKPVERVALEAWCSLSFPSHPNPQTLATPFLRVILFLTHSPLGPLPAHGLCPPPTLWRKRGAAEASLHADKESLLLETEANRVGRGETQSRTQNDLVNFVTSAPSNFGGIE